MRIRQFTQALEKGRTQRGAAILGVCNVTPDSFSDGGRAFTFQDACALVDQLFAEGADVVDIGGESTRPGAPPVAADEQIRRVVDVVAYASTRGCVSIDTTNPTVAAACLERGASAINDVSCLRDPELAVVAERFDAALIISHVRGEQSSMAGFGAHPDDAYRDVVLAVLEDWEAARARARSSGVSPSSLVMDPGLGFTKSARQSAELLARTRELVSRAGAPVLVGASRKSFLTLVDAEAPPHDRVGASLAAALFAAREGAAMVRVHDVRATAQALLWQTRLHGRHDSFRASRTDARGEVEAH